MAASEASPEVCVGCWSEVNKATEEVQNLCDMGKFQVEERLGNITLQMFSAIEYKSQIVAGTNYVVKIRVFDSERGYIQVQISQALPCYGGNVNISKVLPYMTKDDAI